MSMAANDQTRVLIVEDESLVAMDMAEELRDAGYAVIGPVGFLRKAVEMARAGTFEIALLDVNLRGERVYPVADVLIMRGIPFLFLTGYSAAEMPPRFADRPMMNKPVQIDALINQLGSMLPAA